MVNNIEMKHPKFLSKFKIVLLLEILINRNNFLKIISHTLRCLINGFLLVCCLNYTGCYKQTLQKLKVLDCFYLIKKMNFFNLF